MFIIFIMFWYNVLYDCYNILFRLINPKLAQGIKRRIANIHWNALICKYEQYKQNVNDCSHNITTGYGNKFSPDEVLCRRWGAQKRKTLSKASKKNQIAVQSKIHCPTSKRNNLFHLFLKKALGQVNSKYPIKST